MYRVDRNNFFEKNKNATVYTPDFVSNFIYEILKNSIDKNKVIFDPCVGKGSLLNPWIKNNYKSYGVDIINTDFKNVLIKNYLDVEKNDLPKNIGLVIMNPPFNLDHEIKSTISKKYGRKPLLPEVWLMKTLELFDKNIPIVLFTPYGLRLNLTMTSKRWIKFINEYPQISSIVSLPKNVFEGVLFHSEILIFNIKNIKPHYFLGQNK
ncbi:N-6 DNA methylase [Mycoplasma sp. SG1]|uniref:N-6 DNA methylase n=1 Tax=Mycoplasma sp. SG1 TaxID=2810348 RepID=UPI00202425D7|nr:N-6 DNA methylase [Mycoplasma sp. SG1]URM53027.1 N-6 DNA methylase [Mycoplasma sp. SG1]